MDQIAKSATQKNYVDHHIPLSETEIKSILKNELKENWETTITKPDFQKCNNCELSFTFKTWGMKRREEVIMHLLRLGTCKRLKNFLYKIGKHPDRRCETCATSDDIEHFLLVCPKYNAQRQIL